MIFKSTIFFLGRLCFSSTFILSGVYNIIKWEEKEQSLINAMLDFLSYGYEWEFIQKWFDFLLPWVSQILMGITILQILGGLLILLGIQMRFGALLLCLVLIPLTILFHPFWFLQGEAKNLQLTAFLNSLSVFGASLMILSKRPQ